MIRFWPGHANRTITDAYSKINEDIAFRRKVAEQAGIGFELPIENREVAPKVSCRQLSRKELKLKRKIGSPGRTRTCNISVNSRTLYH